MSCVLGSSCPLYLQKKIISYKKSSVLGHTLSPRKSKEFPSICWTLIQYFCRVKYISFAKRCENNQQVKTCHVLKTS